MDYRPLEWRAPRGAGAHVCAADKVDEFTSAIEFAIEAIDGGGMK